MIANKEEAEKCVSIAKQALQVGNAERALKYAQKAHRLHASAQTEQLLDFIKFNTQKQSTEPASGSRPSAAPAAAPASSPAPTSAPTNPAVQQQISGILKAKTYYEILGVERQATDTDIKKAYRKLALTLHPDKSKGAKTEEAFKAVTRAFSCLSDPEKRAFYDATGYETRSDAAVAQTRHQPRQSQFFTPDEIDPEEIFNMFFGSGGWPNGGTTFSFPNAFGPRQRHHHQRQQQQQQAGPRTPAEQQRNQLAVLLQLLPVLLIFGYTFLSGVTQPAYSLNNEKYGVAMETARLQVPFYVKSHHEFENGYPYGSRSREKLEGQVERQYYEELFHRCQQEKLTQRRLYSWGGREQAQALPMPNCSRLMDLKDRMVEMGQVF